MQDQVTLLYDLVHELDRLVRNKVPVTSDEKHEARVLTKMLANYADELRDPRDEPINRAEILKALDDAGKTYPNAFKVRK